MENSKSISENEHASENDYGIARTVFGVDDWRNLSTLEAYTSLAGENR
jgi:hypothetical protein